MMKEGNLCVIFLVLVCCVCCKGSESSLKKEDTKDANVMDVSDFSIYYDIKTNQTIKNMLPRPWYTPGWLLRLPFTGGPCVCDGYKCSCCTGIRIQTFNFDRRTCVELTYSPADSMIAMDVLMNNDSVFRNSFSARNPPPFCVPIPVPYLPPGLVDMCVRLFDISIIEQKLHVCMDMDTRVDKAPVLILHFDCMDMGFAGVGLSKPGGNDDQTNIAASTQGGSATGQLDSDVYDSVTEDMKSSKQEPYNITAKYI